MPVLQLAVLPVWFHNSFTTTTTPHTRAYTHLTTPALPHHRRAANGHELNSILQSVGAIAVIYNNPLVNQDSSDSLGHLKLNRYSVYRLSSLMRSDTIYS